MTARAPRGGLRPARWHESVDGTTGWRDASAAYAAGPMCRCSDPFLGSVAPQTALCHGIKRCLKTYADQACERGVSWREEMEAFEPICSGDPDGLWRSHGVWHHLGLRRLHGGLRRLHRPRRRHGDPACRCTVIEVSFGAKMNQKSGRCLDRGRFTCRPNWGRSIF